MALALLPVFAWFYWQLKRGNLQKVWVKNFLTGSGWNQAQAAAGFLKEIDDFEQEG